LHFLDGTPVVKVIDFGIAKATGQQLGKIVTVRPSPFLSDRLSTGHGLVAVGTCQWAIHQKCGRTFKYRRLPKVQVRTSLTSLAFIC
jgi:hypothetical protein